MTPSAQAGSQGDLPLREGASVDPAPGRKRQITRLILLDRALESLPLFRLSDSSDDNSLSYATGDGGRWRVLPYPGDRLPGTFDQDVFVELLRRFHDAGAPVDGVLSFTLHSFLRSIGRKADGRTYGQLRTALARLERTTLESLSAYYDAAAGRRVDDTFSLLASVSIMRRRVTDENQFTLFPILSSAEPGVARVVLSPALRNNLAAGHTATIQAGRYAALASPVARRLYRLLALAQSRGTERWQISVRELARLLPLAQKYPSHLLRVLHPANEMLIAAGLLTSVELLPSDSGGTLLYVVPDLPVAATIQG